MDIIEETIERYNYFRDVQACPLNDKFNYKGWLSNFTDKYEKELASLILDFFIFYPENMVNQMLRTSVGKAGSELSKYFKDWKHEDFKNRCYYSFIPGEDPNASDSGYLFTRKLKHPLNIPEERLIDYRDLYNLLESSMVPLPIIFVDDFVGSGAQCYKAWSVNKGGKRNLTLEQISLLDKHKFIYAPLIINYIGYKRIQDYCNGLALSPAHIITEEYDLFNEKCICWQGDKKYFNDGVELLLRKSNELGIPSTDGRHVNDEKGFGKQGLAIAFEHGIPDAIPAIFYWETDNWIPLVHKVYNR
jgi:hypothetical protein